ncbi:MAG: Mrp/NBP35 family ATP-binding protein [Bacteroidia bacterium]
MALKEKILAALGEVEDPDLKKDLVTLGMIKHLEINGQKISFTLELTTPACPMKEMLEAACRTAISQFVDPSLKVEIDITSRVTTQRNNNEQVLKGIKNIIAVASGKGGVGKSTIALNLALGLAQSGASVGLLDADIHGPSLPVMLGRRTIKPETRQVEGSDKFTIIPIEQFGLKAMSMGMLVPENQPMIWRGPMVSSALRQMFLDVEWGEIDYMIVDLPPGTGDIHLTLMQHFPVTGVVIVTTPQQVSLADTRRTIEMFRNQQVQAPVLGIVENMSWFSPLDAPEKQYYLFGKGGGEQLSKEYNLPLLAQVPLFQGMAGDADEGQPALLSKVATVQRPFLEMTARVAQQVSTVNARLSGQ